MKFILPLILLSPTTEKAPPIPQDSTTIQYVNAAAVEAFGEKIYVIPIKEEQKLPLSESKTPNR